MDLGIEGKRALVCGASKGLGRACAEALAAEGVHVTIVARNEAEIRAAAHAIGEGRATPVTADVATAEGRAAALAACPRPDMLINNAAGPPPGDFRTFDRAAWLAAIDANMLSAIEMIRATLDSMIERGFGRIVNITSSAVKSPNPALVLSNAARAGLTGFVAGVARQCARHNVTINNMLPGQFDTDRMQSAHAMLAKLESIETDTYRAGAAALIPAGRFGSPAEFGQICAFLCSAQAGYIVGQNIMLDGGQYPGLL